MSLNQHIRIPNSWAIEGIGNDTVLNALKKAETLIIRHSLGSIMSNIEQLSQEDIASIKETVYCCELAAMEWWSVGKYPDNTTKEESEKFTQLCLAGFTLLRSLPLPEQPEEKISHIFRIISQGYLADRASDVKRWVLETGGSDILVHIDGWNGHVLKSILESWVRLIRRKDWNDVTQIAYIISTLRNEQRENEKMYLEAQKDSIVTAAAWQLVSLYHWAKVTEVVTEYMLQGNPSDIDAQIDFHFEKAYNAADKASEFELGNILRWLQPASHKIIRNSVWNVAKRFNSNITKYVEQIVKTSTSTLELLPPQRSAIFEEGLLDRTHNAVVVSLPTSSGKTHLAIFRILEAINHFGEQKAWIAYTVPTRALVNQISSRLQRELSPLGINVQRLSGAANVDQIEDDILSDNSSFDVIVCTPEKLDVIIRQRKIKRDLVLFIMDEAHSIEEQERGLKHELLLAMVRRDCPLAKFLLLTPFVANGVEIARWLDPQAPGSVSMSLDWQPNDRVIGKFWAEQGTNPRNWKLKFENLATSHPSLFIQNQTYVRTPGPLPITFSSVKNSLCSLACAMASELHVRGTNLVIAQRKPDVWSAAAKLKNVLPEIGNLPTDVETVIKFLQAEYGNQYELADLLKHGIAVHHSGLSEDARFLIEWLTEESHIKILCATTTIAQGINFPVSSILISSVKYPYGRPMKYRDFWNLAGRAGRLGQPGVGLIGLASRDGNFGSDTDLINGYLQGAHGDLLSSLLSLYKEAKEASSDLDLRRVAHIPSWSAFLQYLAHLYNHSDKDRLLGAQLELTLRDTYGFISMEKTNPVAALELVNAVRKYVLYLNDHPENAKLAENTGFAPENAYIAMKRVRNEGIDNQDWEPLQLFNSNGNALRKLMGVMLRIPELTSLKDIASTGLNNTRLASLTVDWVNGKSLRDLALNYFGDGSTTSLTRCCDAIYGKLISGATWGLSSLQKLSELDFEKMDEEEKRKLNTIPAMIYYGVNSEEAVIMRMNGVPRSMANHVASEFVRQQGGIKKTSSKDALNWLANLNDNQWSKIIPNDYNMNGLQCKKVWRKLSGIE